MSLIEANGVQLHVQRMGAGPPIVMLHGLLIGNLATWYFTAAPRLARHGAVVLYDLRGHGRSGRPATGYDVATMAADLAGVLATLGPGVRPTLVGHSYGALVALRYTLDNPGKVARLALVEAPLPPSTLADVGTFVARDPRALIDALPEPVRAALAQGKRQARRLLEALRQLVEETSLLADLAAEEDVPDAELARLDCPVLAVYGARSACAPVGERLGRVLPRVEIAVLPGGHYLHLDAPAELAGLLAGFTGG